MSRDRPNQLFLDFETYFSDDYTLRKVTPIEYILDPRFEALGCAFIDHFNQRVWIDGPDLPRHFSTIDWGTTWSISHNTLFDGLILSLRYGIVPKMWGDSMSMVRNWISHLTGRISLEACAKFYGLPPKMETANKFKGMSLAMIKQVPALYAELQEYAIDDAGKSKTIFHNMMRDGFPEGELDIVDMVVRMTTEPKFELDKFVLHEHLAHVKAAKAELLQRARLDSRDNLMRDQAMAAMLLFAGCTPPMKTSPKTGKEGYAFAKTDRAFTALLEHPNPDVQALVAARLGHKSTLEETRTERLISISNITDKMPVPLKYSGAHTHRFSGDWKINLQNLSTNNYQSTTAGKIRKALKAPKDHVVVSIDASQIEARFNATLSGQWDLVEAFRQGRDVYAEFASHIYQMPINKHAHPTQRFVGKQGILSLGYGSSWPVFQNMVRVKGGVVLQDSDATSIVYIYRQTYKKIVENWDYADKVVLPRIAGEENPAAQLMEMEQDQFGVWGPTIVQKNALLLPSGNKLRYRDLHHEYIQETGRYQWTYMRGQLPQHVYGAKLTENDIQALAFVHIMEVAIRVRDMTQGLLMPAHQVHDELLYIVPEHLAVMVRDLVVREMAKPPRWMPLAPLAAEGHIGVTYGDTK